MKKNTLFKAVITLSFFVGIGMLVVSLFLPPQGVIDPSVLEGAGIIFSFSALFEALLTDKVLQWEWKHSKLYIGDKKDVDDEQEIR